MNHNLYSQLKIIASRYAQQLLRILLARLLLWLYGKTKQVLQKTKHKIQNYLFQRKIRKALRHIKKEEAICKTVCKKKSSPQD